MINQAKEAYQAMGVDVDAALTALAATPISMHCWQGDDVQGFDAGSVDGGLAVTGSYPGRARNFAELSADFAKACALIPGKKRINLHASYSIGAAEKGIDRDKLAFRHFEPWVDFARRMCLGIDFNPTCFGHPRVKDGLTLSSPDDATRRFWIEHCRRSREIAQSIGNALDDEVMCNIWIPDGMKDAPADRLGPRQRLQAALDEIFADDMPRVLDCVESKVFGIGVESYTVGSNEFYTAYAAARRGVYHLLDNGHFHPTESTADKIASLLCFFDIVPLHITRPVRWDSDHVPLFDDETRALCMEIVRNDALSRVRIGLDFFDASVNRIAAWVVGTRAVQKSLLYALLMPHDQLKNAQNAGDFTTLLVLNEAVKTLPFGAVWEHYCETQVVPQDGEWLQTVLNYSSRL